ncbi:sensor histidine kinase [Salininema proteolyticum]|uniref:histidine kinase n=1 Tax=Salininema proteolyticum TaxID=1607685 RepID=A0ABV8TX22_9ACTN
MRIELSGPRPDVRDWLIGTAVAAVLVVAAVSGGEAAPDLGVLAYVLLIASGFALVAARRAPVLVLILIGLFALGYHAAGLDVPLLAYLFAVYAAVRSGNRFVTIVVSVAVLAALPLAAYAAGRHEVGAAFDQARSSLEIAWLLAAGAAGEALRQAEKRADEAERTREEAMRHRADQERLHIARELHDSLTHQISVIKVQTEVAVHLARKRGEEIPDALSAIRTAGSEANRELRATLEALRDEDAAGPRGVDDIANLVEQTRSMGLDAALTVEGRERDVSAAVGRTAYRIVQEALTNTARHARADTASVVLDYRPESLVVRVDDDGGAEPEAVVEPGFGLTGMNERVSALGGTVVAAPRRGGGFRVEAELPAGRS